MTKIKVYYFSPTGGTLQVAKHLAKRLGGLLHADVEYHSYTLPCERETLPVFDADDIVLWATPVYAGRIPNKTLDYVRSALIHSNNNTIKQSNNPSIAIVTFGNRAYDNALAELVGLMREGGMQPVGAAALVTRHAFSDTLGAGRPNERDYTLLDDFAVHMAGRVLAALKGKTFRLTVPGEAHPEKYYTPLKTNSAPAGFLKAKPSCDPHRCVRCGKCLDVCPMGSIAVNDGIPSFGGICIKCQACRRICPMGAIAFTDPEYLSHVAMIEQTFDSPKRSEFFFADTESFRIREIQPRETPLLEDFLYEAIFIPEGVTPPPKSIVKNEELQVYIRDFGQLPDDKCLVAEADGRIVGAVWSRVMDDYGHVADDTPSIAISLYKEYRDKGIGTELLRQMILTLRQAGYKKVSLSVQKANYAAKMYLKAGFAVVRETEEELIMVLDLNC